MIFLTALSLLLIMALQQVNHTAIPPSIISVKTTPQIKTVPSKHSFTKSFTGLGYQISGKVYQTNEGLLDAQVHDKSFYTKSNSCQFYNSQLKLEILGDKVLSDDLNIESSEISTSTQTAFLLINDKSYIIDQNFTRTIVLYEFTDTGYAEIPKNITVKSLGLNDSDEIDIAMLAVDKVLIVTDGVKFVGIQMKNISNFWTISMKESTSNASIKIDYQFASFNQLLQFELCHVDKQKDMIKVVVVWNTVLKIYHFSLDLKNATLIHELTPPASKYYTSAIIDHNFYALVQGQLVAYRARANSTIQTTFIDLESKLCWGMNKYESTLHIICQEGGVNYVAQFYFDQNFVLAKDALKLNRYYNQIDDVRLMYMFGEWTNPKLLIAGDNDLLLTAYGINRQVLVDSNQKQAVSKFKSLGLQNVVSITNLSNATSTYAVGISTQFIVFFRINENPAEIQCTLDRKDNKMRWNILVEINTTSCFANGQIQQLQSICQYSIPFTFYVSLFEVDSSKELTVNIFVYVVLIACGLLLLGCTFHCKSIRTKAVNEIQKKIDALKKKKGSKPI